MLKVCVIAALLAVAAASDLAALTSDLPLSTEVRAALAVLSAEDEKIVALTLESMLARFEGKPLPPAASNLSPGSVGPLFELDESATSSSSLNPDALLFAHRGNSAWYPDNTLPAFQSAADLGVDVLEMDLRVTSDGYLVVLHDATVDATTNGTGEINEMTWAQVQTLDAGYWFTNDSGSTYPWRGKGVKIPLMSDVFATLGGHSMQIDFKDKDSVHLLIDEINQFNATSYVTGGTTSILDGASKIKIFQNAFPNVPTAASVQEALTFTVEWLLCLSKLHKPVSEWYQVPYVSFLNVQSYVAHAHALEQKVGWWKLEGAVDNADEMDFLLSINSDGIITNDVATGVAVFKQHGLM